MICPFFSPPEYFIIAEAVPPLLYYSYLPALFISLPLGFYLFIKNPSLLLNKLLFTLTIFFALWAFFVLILWTNINSNTIVFFWSFLGILSSLIAINSVYLISVFLRNGHDVSLLEKIFYLLALIPAIILTPTSINISGFDLNICGSSGYVGWGFVIYYCLLGLLAIPWIIGLLIKHYKKSNLIVRKQIILMGIGIVSFLSLFFGTGYYVNYVNEVGLTTTYNIELYGMFGMIIFIIFIGILIVKFNTFNVKLFATQALIWGLIALIGSQFFFIQSNTNFILNGITFIGTIILGQYLIKSVKKEIEQRELLESLTLRLEQSNSNLENANEKLKGLDQLKTEFVSLASHQLRSPLTAIKGYTSMLLEGDYGDINSDAKEKIERIQESSNNLTLVVEDFLNVSKIEQGGMKYEMVRFDFGELIENTTKDLSVTAEKKGLKLIYKRLEDNKYFTVGDKEKLRQIIVNLLDNSMKYTSKGQIETSLSRNNGKIIVSIKDTGVGISKEIIGTLFEKFARGEGAKLNTSGSGLGLYLVKEIIEAHKGRVWVESEGRNKGSTFFVEMDEAK